MKKEFTIGLVVPFSTDKVPEEGPMMYPGVTFIPRAVGVRALTPEGYDAAWNGILPAARQLAKEGVDAIMVIGTSLTFYRGYEAHQQLLEQLAPGDLRTHVGGIREPQLEQAEQPAHPVVVDLGAIVQVIEQRARLGVETDVPYPPLVVDLALRPDRDCDAQEMRDPLLQDAAERIERGAPAIQADGEIVALVAIPVGRRVARVEGVEVHGANRRAILLQELAQAAERIRARMAPRR